MNQMHDICYRLKSNLGAIEGAASGSGAGRKQTVATLLPIEARLGLIRGTTRLVQYLLDLRAKSTHRRSLSRCRRALEKFFSFSLRVPLCGDPVWNRRATSPGK
jgi:hypothetical protein